MEGRRRGALGFVQIDVAGRQSQPVLLANRRHAVNLDPEIEIAGEPPDDLELLEVLFAEPRGVGAHHVEQLGDHGGHALEMPWPERAAQPFGEAPHSNLGRKTLGVNALAGRSEQEVAAGFRDQPGIPRFVARIGGEVLAGHELLGVDEQARHHPVGPRGGGPDQREVAVMDGAHRRHQPDREPPGAPCGDAAADLAGRADDLETAGCRHAAALADTRDAAEAGLRRAWRAWARRNSARAPGSGARARRAHRPPRLRRARRRDRRSGGRSGA